MKRIFLFLSLTLLTALSFSQTTEPNILIRGTDTLCSVSITDIRLYNNAIADLDACNELADSLYSEIGSYVSIVKNNGAIILDDNIMISKLEGQVKEKSITEESYMREAKRNSNKIKLFKGLLEIISSVAIVELGYIGLQSLKN